ncbi:hypothetical protein KC878_01855, partial [Candidatus Saccharibacteria bacterium]|nr:hypothetical protein [Candidatus Saccharibacteria bacterium]
MSTKIQTLRSKAKKFSSWLQVLALVTAGLLPALSVSNASAAQLTSRKVTISTSQVSATAATYTFDFTVPTSDDVEAIRL